MEHKEFAKYHTWCDEKGIRVYPITEFEVEKSRLINEYNLNIIELTEYNQLLKELNVRFVPNNNPVLFIAKEENGKTSIGNMKFVDKVNTNGNTISEQIGVLLKAIVYKELGLMEIKSTHSQLEGICEAAFKEDKAKIIDWLTAGVPFREAILYLEAFYPDKKESAALIHKLAHCKCGNPIVFKEGKVKKQCSSCGFSKSMKQIEFSNQ